MSELTLLRQTMAATLRVPADRIDEDISNDDLPEWDSLGHVNLMMALEQTFDVYIEVEDFERLHSVRDILNYLAAQKRAR